jgi:hypothetical protein
MSGPNYRWDIPLSLSLSPNILMAKWNLCPVAVFAFTELQAIETEMDARTPGAQSTNKNKSCAYSLLYK